MFVCVCMGVGRVSLFVHILQILDNGSLPFQAFRPLLWSRTTRPLLLLNIVNVACIPIRDQIKENQMV